MGVTSVRQSPAIEGLLEDLSIKVDGSKGYLINQAINEFLVRKYLEGHNGGSKLLTSLILSSLEN